MFLVAINEEEYQEDGDDNVDMKVDRSGDEDDGKGEFRNNDRRVLIRNQVVKSS